jgi:alanyl-tRNA synthetase
MTTQKVFHNNVYTKRTDAVITRTGTDKDRFFIVCDRTVFFPEGGGQPCDTGTVTSPSGEVYQVLDVHDGKDGDVIHYVEAGADDLKPGDTVSLEIDWERRFENMQRHAGEHTLSGAIYSLTGGANKGFHMGSDFMTIDIDTGGTILTKEQLDAAEDLANRIVTEDVPIRVDWFKDAEAASSMPVRKQINISGRISVVTIGDPEHPYDCVACCGTHPSSSGQIGLIKIYKAEPNKGMTRIFFDCGRRALLRCRHDMDVLSDAADMLSSGTDDVIARLNKWKNEEAAVKANRSKLVSLLSSHEVKYVDKYLREGFPCAVREYDALEPNEILKIGFAAMEGKGPGYLFAAEHVPTHTVLLVSSGGFSCGDLVREHAADFDGRGGGRADNARAVFPDGEHAKGFIDVLRDLVNFPRA